MIEIKLEIQALTYMSSDAERINNMMDEFFAWLKEHDKIDYVEMAIPGLFIDSAALNLLVMTYKIVRAHGGVFKISGVSDSKALKFYKMDEWEGLEVVEGSDE